MTSVCKVPRVQISVQIRQSFSIRNQKSLRVMSKLEHACLMSHSTAPSPAVMENICINYRYRQCPGVVEMCAAMEIWWRYPIYLACMSIRVGFLCSKRFKMHTRGRLQWTPSCPFQVKAQARRSAMLVVRLIIQLTGQGNLAQGSMLRNVNILSPAIVTPRAVVISASMRAILDGGSFNMISVDTMKFD